MGIRQGDKLYSPLQGENGIQTPPQLPNVTDAVATAGVGLYVAWEFQYHTKSHHQPLATQQVSACRCPLRSPHHPMCAGMSSFTTIRCIFFYDSLYSSEFHICRMWASKEDVTLQSIHLLAGLWTSKQDGSAHPQNTCNQEELDLIVDCNTVNSFVMRATISSNMMVPPANTTLQ